MSGLQDYLRLNTRKASILHVGGFRPTNDPFASNFGSQPLGAPGEVWPDSNGKPLLFICQMNLTTAPAVPPLLADLQFLTFFVDLEASPLSQENGSDWRLFAYPSLAGLAPIARPANAPTLNRGFECRWETVDDHPSFDDPARVVPEDFDDSDESEDSGADNVARTKIGGYPSTIQSEPWWDSEDHPAKPQYCLQINSEEKASLAWGDAGTVYLARGTAEGARNQWFLDWQTY